MAEAIVAMVEAFAEISSGDSEAPVRTVINNSDGKSCLLSMPCYSKKRQLYSVKLVTVFPDNTKQKLPVIQGKLMLFDGATGAALAMMDAAYVTALRTGAAAGLATKILTKSDASVLAIIGTGYQALLQVEAVMAVRPIRKILVKGRTTEKSEGFCKKLESMFQVSVVPVIREDDLLRADIICTVTNSSTPVLDARFVKPGAHINAMGGYTTKMQEVPSAVMKEAFIVVDQLKASLEEAGDICIPLHEGVITLENIQCELGELVMGSKSSKRNPDQVSVFKSVGNAAQDLAIGSLVMKKVGE